MSPYATMYQGWWNRGSRGRIFWQINYPYLNRGGGGGAAPPPPPPPPTGGFPRRAGRPPRTAPAGRFSRLERKSEPSAEDGIGVIFQRWRDSGARTAALAQMAPSFAFAASFSVAFAYGPRHAFSAAATAFAAFDREGKGYITEDDLQRVLAGFGRRVDSDSALRGYLAAAAGYDREQRRATYGNFIRVMAHTVKQTSERGETLFIGSLGDINLHLNTELNSTLARNSWTIGLDRDNLAPGERLGTTAREASRNSRILGTAHMTDQTNALQASREAPRLREAFELVN